MNYEKFFGRKAKEVAQDLLGRMLLRNSEKGSTLARIIEVGAYEGGKETNFRLGMQYLPGAIFLMPFRGSLLFNIATEKELYPSCIEIRKVATHNKTIKGSGAITRFLGVSRNLDGVPIGEEIQILGEGVDRREIKKVNGYADNCLGYFFIEG